MAATPPGNSAGKMALAIIFVLGSAVFLYGQYDKTRTQPPPPPASMETVMAGGGAGFDFDGPMPGGGGQGGRNQWQAAFPEAEREKMRQEMAKELKLTPEQQTKLREAEKALESGSNEDRRNVMRQMGEVLTPEQQGQMGAFMMRRGQEFRQKRLETAKKLLGEDEFKKFEKKLQQRMEQRRQRFQQGQGGDRQGRGNREGGRGNRGQGS